MFNFFTKTKTVTLDPNPDLLLKNQELTRKVFLLESELQAKEGQVRKTRIVIPVDINDPTPEDSKMRAAYVARGTEYFEEVFRAKFMRLIAQIREDLDNPNALAVFPAGTTRSEADWFLRGTSNAFKQLLDWGDEMRAEAAENLRKEQAGATGN